MIPQIDYHNQAMKDMLHITQSNIFPSKQMEAMSVVFENKKKQELADLQMRHEQEKRQLEQEAARQQQEMRTAIEKEFLARMAEAEAQKQALERQRTDILRESAVKIKEIEQDKNMKVLELEK